MARQETILVVDDAPDTLEILERNLQAAGYAIHTAPGVREAIALLGAQKVDVVITDLKMPGLSGIDLLRHVRENLPDTVTLMITGYPSVDGAVQAVKTGAEDFLAKPFTDLELLRAVRLALDKLGARRALDAAATADMSASPLIGDSEPMRRLKRQVERVALTDGLVLIAGGAGSGRERVARQIRAKGSRASRPFITLRLGLLAPSDAETELFGGGATGGSESGGLVAAASGGTLYVAGADKAPTGLQTRLLELLAKGATDSPRLILGVGDIPGSTHKPRGLIDPLVNEAGGAMIEIPALVERSDDLLLLVGHFTSAAARLAQRAAPRFSDEAILALKSYAWPGNVSELKAVVERLVLSARGDTIDVVDMPTLMRFSALRDRPWQTLAEVEAEHIAKVLKAVDGKRSRAAEILGIDRKTLREKLKRSGVDDSGIDPDPT